MTAKDTCNAMLTALMMLAVLAHGASASGSPRWEDRANAIADQQRFDFLANFVVDIDERRMCDSKLDEIIFYNDNRCKGDVVGSTLATPGDCFRNIRWMARRDNCWEPDTARSVFIRRSFPVNGVIHVCDHATACTDDGFATITVKKNPFIVLPKAVKDLAFPSKTFPSQPVGYCVDSFEHAYEDMWVKVEFDSGVMQRGLDGAVTRIGVCQPGVKGNPDTERNTMPYDFLKKDDRR
mmetsp:Transcript_1918/g.5614  ORF Transcript_1918/g.5614 Transcript_1918/m.5614 type:complete len:237 (-) Transcript_1918:184-894(-)